MRVRSIWITIKKKTTTDWQNTIVSSTHTHTHKTETVTPSGFTITARCVINWKHWTNIIACTISPHNRYVEHCFCFTVIHRSWMGWNQCSITSMVIANLFFFFIHFSARIALEWSWVQLKLRNSASIQSSGVQFSCVAYVTDISYIRCGNENRN